LESFVEFTGSFQSSIYDTGSIDVEEMVEIVGNLYEMEGVSKVGIDDAIVDTNNLSSKDTAMERATTVFKMLDVNADGELNEDEFVDGCLRDENLINTLNSGKESDRSISGDM
jgi:Ca2+-binding EF-hand superfamily protein